MDSNSHAGSKLLLFFTWYDWFCHFTLAPSPHFSFLVPLSTMVWPVTRSQGFPSALRSFWNIWCKINIEVKDDAWNEGLRKRGDRKGKNVKEKHKMDLFWLTAYSLCSMYCLHPFCCFWSIFPSQFRIPFTAIRNRAKQFIILFTIHI